MERIVKIIVKGRVQGVGYRYATLRRAGQLRVKGTVRNLLNGDVEIIVQAADTDIGKMHFWAQQGPPFAQVDDVSLEDIEHSGFADFRII